MKESKGGQEKYTLDKEAKLQGKVSSHGGVSSRRKKDKGRDDFRLSFLMDLKMSPWSSSLRYGATNEHDGIRGN